MTKDVKQLIELTRYASHVVTDRLEELDKEDLQVLVGAFEKTLYEFYNIKK